MHIIRICTSGSCRQNFAESTLKKATDLLKIKPGETTPDGKFRLETTGCLGGCQEGPNVFFQSCEGALGTMMVEGQLKTHMLPHRFEQELQSLIQNS